MAKEQWEHDQWDDKVADFGYGTVGGPVPYVNLANINWAQAMASQGSPLQQGLVQPPAPPAPPENFLQKFLHFLAHPIKTIEAHKAAQSQSTMHGAPSASAIHGSSDWWQPRVDNLDWDK